MTRELLRNYVEIHFPDEDKGMRAKILYHLIQTWDKACDECFDKALLDVFYKSGVHKIKSVAQEERCDISINKSSITKLKIKQ